MQHGNGIQAFSSGNHYEGEWKDDKMDGHGMFNGVDGHRYGGGFKDGVFCCSAGMAVKDAPRSHARARTHTHKQTRTTDGHALAHTRTHTHWLSLIQRTLSLFFVHALYFSFIFSN
jgi:hypothetical protein